MLPKPALSLYVLTSVRVRTWRFVCITKQDHIINTVLWHAFLTLYIMNNFMSIIITFIILMIVKYSIRLINQPSVIECLHCLIA